MYLVDILLTTSFADIMSNSMSNTFKDYNLRHNNLNNLQDHQLPNDAA